MTTARGFDAMEMTMTTDEMTVTEAAKALGLHYETVLRLCRAKRLPARKVGGQWRVAREVTRPVTTTTPTPQSDGTTSTPESPAAPPSR
ncbi:MAG: DNA-binding protein, partial [Caulobacteraceae bacterium]|nr:DNA-binding protein [Caulobacteraceae bacterium]